MDFEISQVVFTIVVVCLFLWRISYGATNGLFAEAAGLIAVIAAFVAVYFIALIAGDFLHSSFGDMPIRCGYLVAAFVVYRLMVSLGNTLRKVKEIPLLGGLDQLMGAVLGAAEAGLIIYIVEFVTGVKILLPAYTLIMQLFTTIQKSFINN